MLPRSALLALLAVTTGVLALAAPASAGPLTATAPDDLSAGDPLAACPPDGSGNNFPDAEVEPFVDVNPTDPHNIVAIYQQDRYSNGGSKGNVSSASLDGGLTWTRSRCPPTPSAPKASTTARRTRGSRSVLTGRCTR